MIVVGYCRYSSEAQRDGYSIEAQTGAITEWCASHGHTVTHFYIDEARSGTSDDREEFQQMVKDSAVGGFEAVVVHKLDRFARDRYDSAVYRHKLKNNGVRVLSVLEPLDDSPESVIMESVLEGMAEYYSKNLAREMLKGKKVAARRGQFLGGRPPLGYGVTDDHHYVVVPEEAATVREIFSRFAGGDSASVIARDLNARGLRGRVGAKFTAATLRVILTNPIYTGRYAFFKTSEKQEPITVDDAVPVIVQPSLFDAANVRLTSRGPNRRYEDFLLTGYLFPETGPGHYAGSSSFTNYKLADGTVRRSASEHYVLRAKNPDCPRSFRKDQIEEFVFGAIEHVLFSGSTLDWLLSELKTRFDARAGAGRASASELNAKLDRIQTQKGRLLDLYISGSVEKAAYSAKFAELGRAEELVREELKRATAAIPAALDVEKLRAALLAFVKSPGSDSLEYKKRLLSTFVEKVAASKTGVTIYFKFPIPGNGGTYTGNFADSLNRDLTRFSLSAKFELVAIVALDYSSPVLSLL